jgi:hypothetical protein
MTGKQHSLAVWRLRYWERLGHCDKKGQFISLHDLEVNPYQRVAAETNHDRHSLIQITKECLRTAVLLVTSLVFIAFQPGIQSAWMRSSSSIVRAQTQTTLKLQPVKHMVIYLTHHLNTTFEDIAFFLATRYMQFLLSLLASFKRLWACRRKHRWTVSTFTTMGS